MSFNISARGIGYDLKPFYYKKEDNLDGDSFKLLEVLTSLNGNIKSSEKGIKESIKEGVKDTVKDEIKDKIDPSISLVDLVASLGNMELLRAIKTQVTLLAMHNRKRVPYIFLTARKERLLLPDICENAKYNFPKSGDPGTDFLKKILPALEETDMNNYGVAAQLLSVLVNYDEMLSKSDPPQIMIEVWK